VRRSEAEQQDAERGDGQASRRHAVIKAPIIMASVAHSLARTYSLNPMRWI
jgi:hypothetical protein